MNLTEFERIVEPAVRAEHLGQTGRVLWLTGLSGSGKSTIAFHAEKALLEEKKFVTVLDGDSVRLGLCQGLGFSQEGRHENLRRVAHVARLMAEAGLIVVCAFVSPSADSRSRVREIVMPNAFDLVYVDTSLSVCEQRDPKGLYRKARRGEVESFTGVSAPYDVPLEPSLTLDGSQAVAVLVDRLLDRFSLL